MEYVIQMNSVNQAEAGTYLLREGETAECVCLILKGKAAVDGRGVYLTLGAGSFLGLNDLYEGKYLCDYISLEDVSFYAFPVKNPSGLGQILSANKEYGGLMLWSFSRYISDLTAFSEELTKQAAEQFKYCRNTYERYREISSEQKLKPRNLQLVHGLQEFHAAVRPAEKKLRYYREAAGIALDKHKDYFSGAPVMVQYHVEEEAELINGLLKGCREAAEYLEDVFHLIINQGDENLFVYIAALIGDIRAKNGDENELTDMLDELTERINKIDIFFSDCIGRVLYVDRERLEKIYAAVLSGGKVIIAEPENEVIEEIQGEDLDKLTRSLQGSLRKILAFSEWDPEKADRFERNINEFVQLQDRMLQSNEIRKLKKEITEQFFDLYMEVFLNAYRNDSLPPAVELFLNYAFVDERLIDREQLAQLWSFPREEQQPEPCRVYSLREWLTLIYEMKRVPSKSEFDMEYEETLRDMKKRGQVSDAEIRQALNNPKRWLDYEIHNVFSCNDRLINGQISTFVPILYGDSLSLKLSSSFTGKKTINDLVVRLLQKDPTVFYRELMYTNVAGGLEREYIMRPVYPEIILFPISGANGIMWQDISGKHRDSSGRFLMPRFFEGRPEDTMVRMLGRFRWELCRTIQGSSWNSIQVKSLTSEYCDYLQYFRKNHELSEEKKEKLKMQIQHAKGNSRETFVQDYEMWIKYESTGAIRMNKVAREILATYCPFAKQTRKSLAGQPIFDEAGARFERNLTRKLYELDLHYRNLEKDNINIPEEMLLTMEYYKTV